MNIYNKNLIKIKKEFTNNNLIYLEKNTYKIFKRLKKDIKKRFKIDIYLTDGYKTNLIITNNNLSNLYISGRAFNIYINKEDILNYIDDNLTIYGLIKENNLYYYTNNTNISYIINKYHLTLEEYFKMFK